jgi:hypothetical protein
MSWKKLPNKIRFKSKVTYEVLFSDCIGDKETTLAECRYDHKQILIKNGQSDQENWKCLIHEIIHGLEFEYRIPIPHKIVYLLETAVFKYLKLNGFLDE